MQTKQRIAPRMNFCFQLYLARFTELQEKKIIS